MNSDGRDNRRKIPRTLTLRTGLIVASADSADGDGIACAVLDESPDGACLLVPENAAIPDSFSLVLDGGDDRQACSVKWRTGCRIGVETKPPTEHDPSGAAETPIRARTSSSHPPLPEGTDRTSVAAERMPDDAQ
jgi:hypothetical protein